MEKVKLTREQAEAIEEIKDKDYAINILALQKRPDHALATLEISQIAKLLYGLVDYEVEPEKSTQSKGDKMLLWGEICELEELGHFRYGFGWTVKGMPGLVIKPREFRHATPQEIYWLETLGRDSIADFKDGDIFVNSFGRASEISRNGISINSAKKAYDYDGFSGIYPAESFKPFPKEAKE